jgi:hypothetical protein
VVDVDLRVFSVGICFLNYLLFDWIQLSQSESFDFSIKAKTTYHWLCGRLTLTSRLPHLNRKAFGLPWGIPNIHTMVWLVSAIPPLDFWHRPLNQQHKKWTYKVTHNYTPHYTL